MATIDIRATVTCSLGPLISGSISDDYLQNSGLVMTRGSCEITGIHTPAVGTSVTFSYAGPAGNKTIPRQLLVLSSFADPFRNITKVELGCRLTYMKDASPAPVVDGTSALETGRRQQCLNGYIDYPADSKVGFPISASALMNRCLAGIGVTASSNPLTNMFNRESVDLSAGYVPVLGDLLLSEGYVGYMDAGGTLQIRDLSVEGGSGPQVTSDHIVDLDAVGVGDLPGEAVIVRYNSTKLKGDIDPTSISETSRNQWEEDEVTGDPQTFEIRFQAGDTTATRTGTYIPYAKTTTKYGKDQSFDNTTCVIAGREGADLSNSVISRETKERTVIGVAAANYCTELLTAGIEVDIAFEGTVRKVETYEYDDKGELIKLTTETYEPQFKWLGGIDVDYVYYDAQGTPIAVTATRDEVLVERTVEEYWTVYDRIKALYLKAGETYEPAIEAQKTRTSIYQNWTLTQSGQQGAAQVKESAPFANVTEATEWLARIALRMSLVDVKVRTDRPRDAAGQVRAAAEVLLAQKDQNGDVETTAQIAYALGSAQADRFKSFSMPYQSDDIYLASGSVFRGDAEAKALRFGRIQNRLLMGNRNGVNLQLHPSKMPASPFDPLYLTQGGLTVQYRANGIAWAFSSEGVVSSVDALYWGVAGGTGTAWVPVAPGVTTFPPAPPVVGGVIDVPSVVPPWNETVPFEGVTKTVAVIQDFTYAVGDQGTTDIGVAITRTKMQYVTKLSADARVFNLNGQAAGLQRIRGIAADAGVFQLTGMAAGSVGFYVLRADHPSYDVSGKAATLLYQRAPMRLEAGTFNVTGRDAGSFLGKGMELGLGVFTVGGQDAALKRTRRLSAAAGDFSTAGEAATLVYVTPQFTIVTYTGTGALQAVTGAGFKPGMIWNIRMGLGQHVPISDSQRGGNKYWQFGSVFTQITGTATQYIVSFDSDGFTVGGNDALFNSNTASYRAMCWKEGAAAVTNTDGANSSQVMLNSGLGLSVFTFIGAGSTTATRTVGHGLGAMPDVLLVKQIGIGDESGYLRGPGYTGSQYSNLTASSVVATSTNIFVGLDDTILSFGPTISDSKEYVGYAMRSVPGVSKFGTYSGSLTTTTLDFGFTPRFVVIKSVTGFSGIWNACWMESGTTGHPWARALNLTNSVPSERSELTFTATGVEIAGNATNNNSDGATYMYMAWA